MVDVTQLVCSANLHGETHHMIEVSAGHGERAQVCLYCRKSAAELRAEAEASH